MAVSGQFGFEEEGCEEGRGLAIQMPKRFGDWAARWGVVGLVEGSESLVGV